MRRILLTIAAVLMFITANAYAANSETLKIGKTRFSPSLYTNIDAYVLSAPASSQTSISNLAAYLRIRATNDLLKARAIYRWITKNISYNVSGYFSGNYGPNDAASVFARRTSVCQGYSELFQELGTLLGLKTELVSGYAKGYGFNIGQTVDGIANHAWTAVCINGEWYLIDSTWGAGHLSGSSYVWSFKECYFLTSPEDFFIEHFPTDPQWQLLDKQKTLADFQNSIFIYSDYLELKVKSFTSLSYFVNATNSLELAFSIPDGYQYMANLSDNYGRTISYDPDFLWRENGRTVFYYAPLSAGNCQFSLSLTPWNNPYNFSTVMKYLVYYKTTGIPRSIIPRDFSAVGKSLAIHPYITNKKGFGVGMNGNTNILITALTNNRMEFLTGDLLSFVALLQTPDGKDISDQCFVERISNFCRISIRITNRGDYRLTLTPISNRTDYSSVVFPFSLKYLIRSTGSVLGSGRSAYPKITAIGYLKKIRLTVPLNRYLKIGSTNNFQIYAPEVAQMAVIQNGNWTFLSNDAATHIGKIVSVAKQIRVVGRVGSQNAYWDFLEYTGY